MDVFFFLFSFFFICNNVLEKRKTFLTFGLGGLVNLTNNFLNH